MNAPKFLNTPEDCQWLRETALKAIVCPPFASFMFAGNEDCPTEIALYSQQNPLVTEGPIARLKWHAEIAEYL